MRKAVYRRHQKKEIQTRQKKAAETVTKHSTVLKRTKPLTSPEDAQRTRKEINAINRRRAKNMERDVARYLKGRRVPSSGAIAGMKGDCVIPLSSGHYYVECKSSAQESFPLSLAWFDKVLTDVRSMNSRFGILVIHYHGKRQNYVFLSDKAMTFLATRSSHGFTLDVIRADIKPRDIRLAGNKPRKILGITEKQLTEMLVDIKGFKTAAFLMESGTWYVFLLEQFRDIVEGV